MHSTPGEGTSGDEDDVERTVQGTLDRFARLKSVSEPKPDEGRAVERRGATASAIATAGRPPAPVQRSIDAFAVKDVPSGPELEARAPRAMAALALEREIERVARREAKAGVSRDELVIAVARECNVPLEDLTLVDGYISDLVLEGKLRLVGERVLLAPSPQGPSAGNGAATQAAQAAKGVRRKARKGGGGRTRKRRGKDRPKGRPRGRKARSKGGDGG